MPRAKHLWQEPNVGKQLYMSLCFGVLYSAWGSYESLVLVFFENVQQQTMGFISMIIYYSTNAIFYFSVGAYIQSKIPIKRRNLFFFLCSLGYASFMLAAMNMAYCNDDINKEQDSKQFRCDEFFVYFTVFFTSILGGLGNGLIFILQTIQSMQYARPWCRGRFSAMINSFMIGSWALGLFFTYYILPALNNSIHQYYGILSAVTAFSGLLFLFLQPPLPPKVDQRNKEEKEDTSINDAANIIDEIQESDNPQLDKLIQSVSRSFSEERAILKYLKMNQTESGKQISFNSYKLRNKELWSYVKNDIIFRLLLPSYLLDGLAGAWWIQCSLWIVRTIEKQKQELDLDSVGNINQDIGFVIKIDVAGKLCELIFVNLWGFTFDRASRLAKKAGFLVIHLILILYFGSTMIGYTIQQYEVFYSVAIFYGIGMQGLKVLIPPVRNEQYAPDQRRILYGVTSAKFFINFLQGFGFFAGQYLIRYNPIYYILLIIPFYILSFINTIKRLKYLNG